jgi:hypothetical protein
VVWAAEVKEEIPQIGPGEYHHIKPIHKVLDLTETPTEANVSNLINDVWNRRLEEAQRPVMAARDAGLPGACTMLEMNIVPDLFVLFPHFSHITYSILARSSSG